MADTRMERKKRGLGWLWALLALIVVALILWWIWAAGTDEEPIDPAEGVAVIDPLEVEPVEVEPAPGAAAELADLGAIVANPGDWVGRDFPAGEVEVAEVPTDRGFWITGSGGERLLALVVDQPAEQPVDVNPGQRLRITGGTLRDSGDLPQLAGDPLDDATRQIVEDQEIFLVVDEDEIEVLAAGEPQAGTDPAQGFGEGAQ